MVLDKEHISEDFGDLYKEEDIMKMELEERVSLKMLYFNFLFYHDIISNFKRNALH